MSWQNKVLGLVKKYGTSAKFAASTILKSVVPGSPAVIALVEHAFDLAKEAAQGQWEDQVLQGIETSADNQLRLEQMLDILGGDLQFVFAQVAALEGVPDQARKLLDEAKKSDALLRQAVEKLDHVAHQFERLERLTSRVLDGQTRTNGKLDEMSSSMSKQSQLDRQKFYDSLQPALDGFDASVQRRIEQLFQACGKRLRDDVEQATFADLEQEFVDDVATTLFPEFHVQLNAAILVNGQFALRIDDIESLRNQMCRSVPLRLNVDGAGGLLSGMGAGAAVGAGVGSFVPVVGTALGAVVGGMVGAFGGKSRGKQQLLERRLDEVRKNLDAYLAGTRVSKAKARAFILERCLRPLA